MCEIGCDFVYACNYGECSLRSWAGQHEGDQTVVAARRNYSPCMRILLMNPKGRGLINLLDTKLVE